MDGSADHERETTADTVDDKGDVDECCAELDDTIDTCCEERSGRALDTDAFEDGGSEVVDGVSTGEFVEDEEGDGHSQTTSIASVTEDVDEDLLDGVASFDLLFGVNLSADFAVFGVHVWVISWKLSDHAEILETLFSLVMTDEISGTFWGKGNESNEENTGDDLDTEGGLPLSVGVVVFVV